VPSPSTPINSEVLLPFAFDAITKAYFTAIAIADSVVSAITTAIYSCFFVCYFIVFGVHLLLALAFPW